MQEMKIGERLVTLYDDIKQLPATLHQKATQYQVMDAELPGSEADLDAALARLQQFQRAGQTESFDELMYNIRLARQLILTNYDPRQLEWACYLHSVDGILITDYSEPNLEKLIANLNPTQGDIEAVLELVKKKSTRR